MTYEEAAALGVGISTAALALYQMLKLRIPSFPSPTPPSGSREGPYVLVSGGTTATGTIVIQLLRVARIEDHLRLSKKMSWLGGWGK